MTLAITPEELRSLALLGRRDHQTHYADCHLIHPYCALHAAADVIEAQERLLSPKAEA